MAAALPAPAAAQDATWFEGALLIDGSGDPPVADAAFLVEDGVFAWVGRRGDREPPPGAARADLTGKTVIPALIDAHQHLGLTNVKDGTHSKANYTRANLVEHLELSAYHGVAATMSLGLEHDEALAFALRDADVPNAARFLTSGRGIAATPTAGPQQAYRLGIPRGRRPRPKAGPPWPSSTRWGRSSSRSGSTTGAAPSPSWRRPSTGPSSTRRTPAACG